MRVRPTGWVLLVVLAVATVGLGSAAAGARLRIRGAVRCTISNAEVTFFPGLRNRNHIEGIQKGRGPAQARLTADLRDCTDPASGPAPAAIDHGTLSGRGTVGNSSCERLDHVKLLTHLDWMTADEDLVGATTVKLAITDLAKPSFDDPWTFSFAAPARPSSTVFPRDLVSFALTTTAPNWEISGACGKLELDALALGTGTFAADAP